MKMKWCFLDMFRYIRNCAKPPNCLCNSPLYRSVVCNF